MEETERLCITCSKLKGCKILSNSKGEIDVERVVFDDTKECSNWGRTGNREISMRRKLLDHYGVGSIRAIHTLPNPDLEDREEDTFEMSEIIADLGTIARADMTRKERSEQLTYMTDEDGNILSDEDGHPIPRRALHIRRYAEDVLGLPKDQASFWSIKQLVQKAVKAEAEAGIIGQKSGKKKSTKSKENQQPTQQSQEETMATTKKPATVRRVVRRTAGAKKSAVPDKAKAGVAAKSAKSAKPTTSKKTKPKDEAPPPPPDNGGELQALKDEVGALKAELGKVKKELKESTSEILAALDQSREEAVQIATAMHDHLKYIMQLSHTEVEVELEDGSVEIRPFVFEDEMEGILANEDQDIRAYFQNEPEGEAQGE